MAQTLSLNSADLQGLKAVILADFQKSLTTISSTIDPLIKTIPISADVVNVPFETTFQTTIPKWISQKEVIKLGAQFATVQVDKFGVVYRVPREALEDDQLGLYASSLSDFGRLASQHKAACVTQALKDGKTVPGFDGKPTFATDHDVGDGQAQSNLFQGTEFELSAEALQAVVTAAARFHGASGNALGQTYDTVIVGHQDRFKIADILLADVLQGGGTNTMKGILNFIILDEVTEAGVYYLANMKARPLVYLERTAPEVVLKFDPEDDRALNYDEYEAHIRARGVGLLGPWPTIARVEGF